jgi:short-subunit dehydrogenase
MSAEAAFRTRYGPWALVAGAAVGLGAEFARQLAGRGLALVLLDCDAEALRQTAAAVAAAHGVSVRPVVVDLGRPDVVDTIAGSSAGLEIGLLVYNAALGTVAPFLALDPGHTERMLDVNCRAPLRLLHALVPPMVARGRGGVVLMSSLAGSFGAAQLAVYAATKAFALVLADALWVELREHGIDVLAVQPGSTRTPGWESSQPAGHTAAARLVMEPADVVREALDALGTGPNLIAGEENRQAAEAFRQLDRRQVIEAMSQITRTLRPNYRRREAR